MRIVRVAEPEQLEVLYQFRHDMYVDDLGWLPAEPSGLLRDGYDDLSYNYAAFDSDNRIVGSMRVVTDSAVGLPLERVCPLNGYRDDKRLVELCRLVVNPGCRGSRIGGLLMKAGYQRAVMCDASHIMLDTYVGDREARSLYEKMGFDVVAGEYQDPDWCCELPVVTLALDMGKALAQWPEVRAGLYRFFTTPDPAIDHG